MRKAAKIADLPVHDHPETKSWKRNVKNRAQFERCRRNRSSDSRESIRFSELDTCPADAEFREDEEYFDLAEGVGEEEADHTALATRVEMFLRQKLTEHDTGWGDDDLDDDCNDGSDDDDLDDDDTGPVTDAPDDDIGDPLNRDYGPAYDRDEIGRLFEKLATEQEAALDAQSQDHGPVRMSTRKAVLADKWSARFLDRRSSNARRRTAKPWASSSRPPHSLRQLLTQV
ncbi:MAG: hypothetical protein WC483_05010 [Candidatus Paceibacterota bacterium]